MVHIGNYVILASKNLRYAKRLQKTTYLTEIFHIIKTKIIYLGIFFFSFLSPLTLRERVTFGPTHFFLHFWKDLIQGTQKKKIRLAKIIFKGVTWQCPFFFFFFFPPPNFRISENFYNSNYETVLNKRKKVLLYNAFSPQDGGV